MKNTRRTADTKRLRDEAAKWAIHIDSGDLTDADRARLQAWLAADPSHPPALEQALTLWSDIGTAALPVILKSHAGRKPRHGLRGRRMLRAAAAVAALLVMGFAVLMRDEISHHLRADVYTRTGERQTLALSGGSRVMLDADTAVAFRDDARHRAVELLTGRIQVDVGHDDPRPFHVTVHGTDILDTGTVFQVDARDETAEVSVSQGSVSVNTAGGSVNARAGERLRMDAAGHTGPVAKADLDALTAWTRGRMVFEDLPLTEVVAEIQRYSHARIVVLDAGVGARRVSGVFDASRPDDALRAIEQNLHLRLTRWPGGIVTLDD